MESFRELLEFILNQTTFVTSPAQMNSQSSSFSSVTLNQDISQAELRDIFERDLWDEEQRQARSAKPVIPEEMMEQLASQLRLLLKDYIDSETNSIGLALPMTGGNSVTRVQANGLVSRETVSDVEDFARGLIKGAAVKGSEQVSDLLSGWLQGKPVEYRTSAILNGPPIEAPFAPLDGIHIENLPLSTDELPASLPRYGEIKTDDYLGRTMVSIDSTASPALFHPQTNHKEARVQVKPKVEVDFETICQALSLESNSFVDAAFYWNDYLELVTFFLFDGRRDRWSTGKARLQSRPSPYSLRTETTSEGSAIRLEGHPLMCLRSETQLARTLDALRTLQASDKTRIAVSRWVKSKDSGERLEDRFIDLRIALECLYLQNFLNEKQTQEMRFRLSLFGAWHLGTDFTERKRIRKKLLKAYDTASKAVHIGALEFTDENRQQLSSVQDLCRRGILKLLEEGPPRDWGDLILGDEL